VISPPRLLAYLDCATAQREDLGVSLAAVAAVGWDAAIVARLPGRSTDELTKLTARCIANAKPPQGRVLVTGRVDVALATGAHGVVARREDLRPLEMRESHADANDLWIAGSVHSVDEAEQSVREGANALIVGNIWETDSHPGVLGKGLGLISDCAKLGVPVYAIGGVTVERARQAADVGAFGVAAISALWGKRRTYDTARELIEQLKVEL
jgi:thiazole tautomerase (transcriptional regulator TenI)